MPQPQSSDEQLVGAVRSGEATALEEIVGRYGGAMHGLARRVLGEDGLAQDATQAVLVQFWRAPERFDAGRGSLRSYLLALTHRRAVDLVRSEERRRAREAGRRSSPVDAGALDLDQRLALDEALDRLPGAERDAVRVAYLGGYTYREAAELLGVAEGTFKSRIRAGLDRLRNALGEEGAR